MQGNEDANQAFENIATGCFKALGTTIVPGSLPGPDALNPNVLLFPTAAGMLVPPDPLRRFVSKQQIKAILGANNVDNDHGFGFVDPQQNQASNGSASYYAWNPPQTPGVRFISIDTNSEGGILGPFGPQPTGSSNGNLDHPQFQWLRNELNKAENQGKLIVIFGHHPVRSMDSVVPDEATGDVHGRAAQPRRHPRARHQPRLRPRPAQLGAPALREPGAGRRVREQRQDLHRADGRAPERDRLRRGTHPRARSSCPAEAPGRPARATGGSAGITLWWEINTSAVADWPHQQRLIEVMDNRDDTLSIFGTVLDHASPATAPDAGDASSFIARQLASIGRTFGFNDPQSGPPTARETRSWTRTSRC